MELNIITGVSRGLGKELFNNLSKNYKCFGITTKNEQCNENIYHLSLLNLKEENNSIKKIINKINAIKCEQINFYLNAAVYDNVNDTVVDKFNILKINFFNQIKLVYIVKNLTKINKIKLIFFSSFSIYNYKSKLNYYKISKHLYLEEYIKNINKDINVIYKLFILGGIKTEGYIANTKNKNKNRYSSLYN